MEYLNQKYPLRELDSQAARQVVLSNITMNEPMAAKLSRDVQPKVVTFIVENADAGQALYEDRPNVYQGADIFVGIELESGIFQVEGSSDLWDELLAFQGLDEQDLENYYLVSEYVSCLKKFGLFEKKIENQKREKS